MDRVIVLLCFGKVSLTHILQGCYTDTGTNILSLYQCIIPKGHQDSRARNDLQVAMFLCSKWKEFNYLSNFSGEELYKCLYMLVFTPKIPSIQRVNSSLCWLIECHLVSTLISFVVRPARVLSAVMIIVFGTGDHVTSAVSVVVKFDFSLMQTFNVFITTKVFTCHSSCAAVACEKIVVIWWTRIELQLIQFCWNKRNMSCVWNIISKTCLTLSMTCSISRTWKNDRWHA